MKVLITGGCGFIGSNIAASYLEDEVEIINIDCLLKSGGERNLAWLKNVAAPHQLHHYSIDIADEQIVDTIFKKHPNVDYICHVAGQVAMTTSLADPRRDFRTNALGTLNILEAARRYSPDALLVYASTNKVYGDLNNLRYGETTKRYLLEDYPNGLNENISLDFASPYGCSKGCADQYVRDWFRNFGLKTIVFRHSSIYGGRQFASFDQGWIGWFCQKAIEQSNGAPPFTIAGSGKQVRDILHAEDIVRLYRCAYTNRHAAAGQVFNIGGGQTNSLSLLELFERLAAMVAVPELKFTCNSVRKSDQRVFIADCEKAKRLFAWAPLVSLGDGLSRNLEWVHATLRSE